MNKKNEQTDISLPLFQKTFRERVIECWEIFSRGEAKLRQLIDQKAGSELITEQLDALLTPAFDRVYAEVGFNGEKHDLILNLEGDWSRLFTLTYFKKHTPKNVLQYWNILVGRQSHGQGLDNYGIQIGGSTVYAMDIQI